MSKKPKVLISLAEYERLKGKNIKSEFAEKWAEIRKIVPERYWGSNSVLQMIEALVADAALGALVRKMPINSDLQRQRYGWYCYLSKKEVRGNHPTPEDALRTTLGEE